MRIIKIFKIITIISFLFLLQVFPQGKGSGMGIQRDVFGKTDDDRIIHRYTLSNKGGIIVKIINYGGIVTELLVPDRKGNRDDVVLGFDSLKPYLADHPYFGCIVGRYANRIAKGKFTLDGKEYKLATNNDGNHLHGGTKGFDKVIWQANPIRVEDGVALVLRYNSKDGEEGYPGNLNVVVIYTLTNENEFRIEYEATTDKPTPVNLTHHSYFNLVGAGGGDVFNNELMIDADKYTVVDQNLIPTGELRSVEGIPMDFRTSHPIGGRIKQVEGGYDHNYVLNRKGDSLSLAARITEAKSGRIMEVYTTEPGIQFYSGNFLDGTITGKGGKVYRKHFGFCLEAQHFPDSPNHPEFPPTILKPNQKYHQVTVYKFSVKK
ncbi:MAG: galactose mutarotase [Ignavibacteriales bacterium]|nr:galactose mutarotase [Ignavibacteriales bacterium]